MCNDLDLFPAYNVDDVVYFLADEDPTDTGTVVGHKDGKPRVDFGGQVDTYHPSLIGHVPLV